jgi:hypothetical protein
MPKITCQHAKKTPYKLNLSHVDMSFFSNMLKNHLSTCKKTHVNMQHLFLMARIQSTCRRKRDNNRRATAISCT